MLVQPRNATEAEELRRLLTETINLTKTAIERGIIKRSVSMPDLMSDLICPIEENALFRPFRRADSDSLSLFMMGLDLAAWEMDDINEAFGLPRTPSPVRIGVLIIEQLGGVGNRTVPAEDIFASAGTVGAPRSERLDVLVKVPVSGEGEMCLWARFYYPGIMFP